MNVLIQCIGFVALGISALSFQRKTRGGILFMQIFSCLLFSVHFFLLGAYTGSLMNLLAASRCVIYYQKPLRTWASKPFWPFIYSAAAVALSALTWGAWYSILPMAASVVGAFGGWLNNAKQVRRLSLCASPMWLVYNLFNRSYAGIATELFILSSILIAMYRYDRKSVSRPDIQK